MKTNKILFLYFFFATLISCTRNEVDHVVTININPLEAKDQINLSEFVDSIKYIKLQTSPDCMLGRVPKLTIGNKYIYAVESLQGVVFIFDKLGKLITKLDKYGKGPGEYNNFTGVFIDANDQYIEISDDNKILKYAVPNLELIEERDLNNIIYSPSMRKFEGAYYYATMQFDNLLDGEMTNSDVIVNFNGKYKALFDKKRHLNGNYHMPFTEAFTVNDRNELFVTLKFDNTFYQLKDLEALPSIRIDFGKYGLDNSIESKSGNEQMELLNTLRNVASFPVLNINNSDILALSYSFSRNGKEALSYYYFQLNENNRIIHTKNIVNDLTNFPKYIYIDNNQGGINHESWHNEYLISIVWPHENIMTDSVYVDGLGKLSPEDNPVIILMKLKNH